MSNPTRKIRFIINPKSGIGKQKIVERRIETYLDKAAFDYEICYTQAKAHAIELSREAAQMGYAAVIAVGGDGTVNEVAQGLLHTQTAMGIMLETLALNKHKAYSRDELIDCVSDDPLGADIFDRTIDSHIKNLRQKLGTKDYIQTVRGIGYQAAEE